MDIADIELVVVYGAPDTPSQFYKVHVYSSPITDAPLIGSFDQYFYNKLIFCYIALWASWSQWVPSTSPPAVQHKEKETLGLHSGTVLHWREYRKLFTRHLTKGVGKFCSCKAEHRLLYSVLY